MSKLDKDFIELVSAYATKNISSEQLEELKKWLDKDERHKAYFKEHIQIYRAKRAHDLSKQINKEEAWDKIQSSISTHKKHPTRSWSIKPWLGYVAAASLAIMLTIYIQYDNLFTADKAHSLALETIAPGTDKAKLTLDNGKVVLLNKGNTYKYEGLSSNGKILEYNAYMADSKTLVYNNLSVPKGGQFSLILSDGTRVWLNSDTKLRYPTSFAKGHTRTVELLYGEAYFDVTPSTDHGGSKFKVVTNLQTIEVLGTEFNVKAYREEEYVYTTLVEGKVKIQKNDAQYVLTPNQQSITSNDQQEDNLVVTQVNVKPEIAWKEGIFSFKGKSLDEIMMTISRWYDVEISFAKEDLKKVKFNGVISKTQDLKNVLNLIKSTQFIDDYEIKSGNQILIK